MLEMQEQTNIRIDGPDWRDKNYEWYRAVWTECAELIDHYGWKWWKKQEQDVNQMKMEVVDIWHFLASDFLQKFDIDQCAGMLLPEYVKDRRYAIHDTIEMIEKLALDCLRYKQVSQTHVALIAYSLGMDLEEIYTMYCQKNVLNLFRQNNGYKEGTYIKHWGGKEDNEHLVELAKDLTIDAEFPDKLMVLLAESYGKAFKCEHVKEYRDRHNGTIVRALWIPISGVTQEFIAAFKLFTGKCGAHIRHEDTGHKFKISSLANNCIPETVRSGKYIVCVDLVTFYSLTSREFNIKFTEV
jgi:dimeric dUTPase (all-alpha-NTP-PPase superfamily)